MSRKLFLPVWLGVMLVSGLWACSSNNKPDQASDKIDSADMVLSHDKSILPPEATELKGVECFERVKQRDTIRMTLKWNEGDVTGDLAYRFYEKDKSSGPIKGKMVGDTVIADYTFDSEGTRSVREVIFIKKDGKLYEGYGDAEERNGRMVFINRSAIKFGEGAVLSTVDCL